MKGVTFETFAIAGQPKPKLNEAPSADIARVGPDYFRVMELPILAGRTVTPADMARNANRKRDGVVVVVGESIGLFA